MVVLSGIAILGTGLLVLTTALGKDIFFTRFMRLVVIKFLLPVIEFVGRVLGLNKDSIRQSFIAMNNSLVISQRQKVRPDRVLVLLPHCIQLFDCEIKVTGDIHKCVQCGRCDIKGLVDIGRKYHIDISVATGGTLARKVIVEKTTQTGTGGGLRARSDLRYQGLLSPPGDRHPQRTPLRPLFQHHRGCLKDRRGLQPGSSAGGYSHTRCLIQSWRSRILLFLCPFTHLVQHIQGKIFGPSTGAIMP